VVVAPFADLARAAAQATVQGPVELSAAYHLDARAENLMALGAYAVGALLLAMRPRLATALRAIEIAGDHVGPERWYAVVLRGLNRLSDRMHTAEVRDLRARIAAIIVPGCLLVALGVAATPSDGAYDPGPVLTADFPLVVALAACAMAGLAVTVPRRHLVLAVTLSGVGFALATTYSLMGAPDVALVAVLIETIVALLFVAVLARVPEDVLRREAHLRERRGRRIRDVVIAVASGVVTTLVVWGAFSREVPQGGMAERHLDRAADAHGKDVVTVILADFRGLDTLVEVTVVAVAVVAVASVLRGRVRR
jgi:multicomponent Na+:H+ antiporter subunit A